jgi:hypothetical protein
MKIIKVLVALLKELMLQNKMLIVSGFAKKMDVSDAVSDALNLIEAFEAEFKDVAILELVMMIVLALIMLGAASVMALPVSVAGILTAVAAGFTRIKITNMNKEAEGLSFAKLFAGSPFASL